MPTATRAGRRWKAWGASSVAASSTSLTQLPPPETGSPRTGSVKPSNSMPKCARVAKRPDAGKSRIVLTATVGLGPCTAFGQRVSYLGTSCPLPACQARRSTQRQSRGRLRVAPALSKLAYKPRSGGPLPPTGQLGITPGQRPNVGRVDFRILCARHYLVLSSARGPIEGGQHGRNDWRLSLRPS